MVRLSAPAESRRLYLLPQTTTGRMSGRPSHAAVLFG